jgi:Ca2+-binding RTX toxin-like protein
MKRMLAASVLALVTALAGAPTAWAAETVCRNQTLTGTYDNIRVPPGFSWFISGAYVYGDIRSNGHVSVVIKKSWIAGNVELKKGSQNTRVVEAYIAHNLQLEANEGLVTAFGNQVTETLQVLRNRGRIQVMYNTIGGNLECFDNIGGVENADNTVGGQKLGQCTNP